MNSKSLIQDGKKIFRKSHNWAGGVHGVNYLDGIAYVKKPNTSEYEPISFDNITFNIERNCLEAASEALN
jgi:hypothetical protein